MFINISECRNHFDCTLKNQFCGAGNYCRTKGTIIFITILSSGQLNIEKQLGRLISTIEHYNFPGCPQFCDMMYRPVCGTDGKTYTSQCRLKSAACTTQNADLAVASQGECAGITLYHQYIDFRSLLFYTSLITKKIM